MNAAPLLTNDAWDRAKARHLLNRAGFGVPRERVESLASMTVAKAVEQVLRGWGAPSPQRPDFLVHPDALVETRQAMAAEADPGQRILINQAHRRREREAIETLKAWWLERMATSPHPLQEKMALFWHGHFATSAQKTMVSWHTYELNAVFRERGLGNLRELTVKVGQSPVMLDYLDNRKSTKDAPNENWARELMELFTLGQGAYSEQDIKEVARAFTGWNCNRYEFIYRLEDHDMGEKELFGRRGHFDGWDAINIIFAQDAAAPFIAGKLWQYFAAEKVDKGTVSAMAAALRQSNFELRPALECLFRSEAFYHPEVMGAQIKSPAQFVVQLADDLDLSPTPWVEMARACRALGQDLFYPPNVKGWEGNRAWINANSLLLRYNVPPQLAQASIRGALGDEGPKGGMMMQEGGAMMRGSRQGLGEQVRVALEALPRDERRALREKIREGSPSERREALQALGIDTGPERAAGPGGLFDELDCATAGACIDGLAARFLVRPLTEAQKRELLELVGGHSLEELIDPKAIPPGRRFVLLRMLTSLAEYQLC